VHKRRVTGNYFLLGSADKEEANMLGRPKLYIGNTACIRSHTAYIQYMEIPCADWASPTNKIKKRKKNRKE